MSFRNLITGAFLALAFSACATSSGGEIDWHNNDSYRGWVTDAATGEPIEGAVVVAVWQILRRHHMFIVEGNADVEVISLEETQTDRDGRFQFAPLGHYSPPLGWQIDDTEFPKLMFFKPGYQPTYLQRFTWEFGDHTDPALDRKTGRTLNKKGWQREVRLFRYLTRPDTSGVTDRSIQRKPEQTIIGFLTSFASGLTNNVNRSGRSARQQKKAVEAQWNAIVTVDTEIRKYRPPYEWDNDEIRDALRPKQDKQIVREPIRAKRAPPAIERP